MSDYTVGTKGTWKGTITSIIYSNNDYSIIEIKTADRLIKAAGNISMPKKDTAITVKGEIIHSDRYNEEQIKVKSSVLKLEPTEVGTAAYFVNCIQGIGSYQTANKLIDAFGTDVNSYMNNVYKLKTCKGISDKTAEKIKKSFEETKHLYPLYIATGGKITKKQADVFYDKYKEQTAEKIKRNPYLLTEIARVGFKTADKIALGTGIKYDSVERIRAVISFVLNEAETDGHIYLTLDQLTEKANEFLISVKELKNVFYQDVLCDQVIPDDTSEWEDLTLCDLVENHEKKLKNAIDKWFDEDVRIKFEKKEKLTDDEICCLDKFSSKISSINQMLKEQMEVLSFNVTDMSIADALVNLDRNEYASKLLILEKANGVPRVYLRDNYIKECILATDLIAMLSEGPVRIVDDLTINAAVKQIEAENKEETGNDYKLNSEQIEAVHTITQNRVSIVTGGPGRGKTTIIKTAIEAWINSKNKKSKVTPPQIFLLAPTGKAAKRMTESTGYTALTIHRFLKRNASGITNDDTLICIDESSMLDLDLAQLLVSQCKRAQIAFVGDADQLPSIGAGNVLEDLVKSKKIPCTFLISCYRNDGSILKNSIIINESKNLQEFVIDNHFRTYWSKTPKESVDMVIKIYTDNIKKYGIKDMIILTPMRTKTSGVEELNKRLQEAVNPGGSYKNEIMVNGKYTYILREGDRVIHTVNNYELDIFNGDTGTIQHIDSEVAVIEMDDGTTVTYPLKNISAFELAYAITYHKAQGSEYKFVINLLTTNDFVLLNKKMLYTGETRAKELCICAGQSKAFYMAINNFNASTVTRNTALDEKIKNIGG